MRPVTPIVRYLLILNALVFAVVVLPREMMGYPLQLEQVLAMYYPTSPSFRPYQILTHCLHACQSWAHWHEYAGTFLPWANH